MDTAYFMTMGGVGLSLAGFAGLFSALRREGDDGDGAVYRWRMRQIVSSSFLLTFLAFGTVVLFRATDDLELTARVISGLAAAASIISTIRNMRPGPAWSSETDRKGAMGSSLLLAGLIAANVWFGSEPWLQAVMLILLLGPATTFIRAVYDGTAAPNP